MTHTAISELPVLLVDDEPELLRSASVLLRTSGFPNILTLEDGRAVAPLLAQEDIGALVLDLSMPHVSGHSVLAQVTENRPDIPVILMTATDDLDTAVLCMQTGAIDYLVKPVDESRLVSSVERALELRELRAAAMLPNEHLANNTAYCSEAFARIITKDQAMLAMFRYAEAIAQFAHPVLITGETGTGKELVAQALHRLSGRCGELVAVNVAGLDDTMFSDTLFGHAKGAYTGADRPREGLIASAADGTLFLDEIGDLTVASQVKLLRLLQDGTFYPLGADRPRQSRARVIVATNCDVVQAVGAGTFRKDLYYRLRTHHLTLPPLRKRTEDLALLVNHFLNKAARAFGKSAPIVPSALHQLLKSYNFPGNVRELEAMVVDALVRHRGQTLSLQSFKDAISGNRSIKDGPHAATILRSLVDCFPDQLPNFKEAEEALLSEALRRADGNQGVAAGILGISRQALNQRLSRRKPAEFSAPR